MNELETTYHIHSEGVFKYVRSRVTDIDLAREIVQDTFVRACENEQMIKQLTSNQVKNWLLKVAHNLCIDYWRKSQKLPGNIELEEDFPSDYSYLSVPMEKKVELQELTDFLYEMLKRLKWEHRCAIQLFDIQHLSYKECSKVLNTTEVAFSSLLKRARKALAREILGKFSPCILEAPLSEKELKKLVYWFDILDFPTNIVEEVALKSQNFFNGFKGNFNDFRKSTYPDKLNDYLLSTVELKKDMVVADFGCGTGGLASTLSGKVSKVIAMDHSIEMIKVVNDLIKNNELFNINPVLMDLNANMSAYYQSFNIGFCCMTLHHVFDPKLIIKELARTLVPGGQFIIADLTFTNLSWKYKDIHDFWSGFKADQMQKWLEAAGLKVIQIEENQSRCFRVFDQYHEDKRIEIPLLFAHAVKND